MKYFFFILGIDHSELNITTTIDFRSYKAFFAPKIFSNQNKSSYQNQDCPNKIIYLSLQVQDLLIERNIEL